MREPLGESVPPPPPEVPAEALLLGRVREHGSGLPVRGEAIAGDRRAPIGEDGRFRLPVLAGAVHVQIISDAHRPLVLDETLAPDEALTLDLRVERWAWDDEIVVYGEATREEVSRTVISAEELRQVPGAFGDPIRALQSLPGVARPSFLEGDIVVRGAEGINTATYIDGIPVPYLFHFFIGRSVINGALLDDVEFYPGGMPSRFGDATQAVVNARLQTTDPAPGVHGQVSVDLLDGGGSAEGNLHGWTWEVGGRYSWVGGLIGLGARLAAIRQGAAGYTASWVYPRYFDYALRVGKSFGDHKVRLMVLGARDALIFRQGREDIDGDGKPDPPEDPDLPYDPNRLLDSYFHRLELRWDHRAGDRWSTTTLSGGPNLESSLIEGLGVLVDRPDRMKILGGNVLARRLDGFPLPWGAALQTGGDVRIDPVAVQDLSDVGEGDETVPTTHDVPVRASAWVEYQHTLGKTWLAPGFRFSYYHFNRQDHVAPDPRLTLRHKVDDHWTVTAFAGRFTQIPPPERYAESLGNPELTLMNAWQASVGFEARWGPLGLDGTVYGTRFGNLVVSNTEVQVNRSAETFDSDTSIAWSTIVPVYQRVDGWAFGGELMLRLKPTRHFWGWIAVTGSHALRVDAGRTYPSDHDQPLAVTLVAAYAAPKLWRFSTRFRVTSGHPFTPLYEVYNPGLGHWTGLQGEINSDRFPWFYQLDLRIDKTWVAKRARWRLYLDVQNVTNTRNAVFATYKPNFESIVPLLWIPVIPTFGLEVIF